MKEKDVDYLSSIEVVYLSIILWENIFTITLLLFLVYAHSHYLFS